MHENNVLKKLAKAVYFRPNTVLRIRFGPLRGMHYRVDEITGLSAWYSGNEREHQSVFKRLVKSGDVVIDVGANWGVHSLYFSKLVGPLGLVVAIEPLPQAMRDLQWHLDINRCSNVRTIEKAASQDDGSAFLELRDSAYTGALAETNAGSAERKRLKIETRKVDTIVNHLGVGQVKLIKIDVEGAETKVLLGAQKTIEKHRPYLVIDLHTPQQDISVAQLALSWSYALSRLSGRPIIHTDRGWPDTNGVWGTILASPLPLSREVASISKGS